MSDFKFEAIYLVLIILMFLAVYHTPESLLQSVAIGGLCGSFVVLGMERKL
jgi:hypothetical protein